MNPQQARHSDFKKQEEEQGHFFFSALNPNSPPLSQTLAHVLSPKFVSSFLSSLSHTTTCPSRHRPPPHPLPESCQQSPSISLKHLWQLMFKSGVGLGVPCYNGKDQASDSPPGLSHVHPHTCVPLFTHVRTHKTHRITDTWNEKKWDSTKDRNKTDLNMLKENKQSVRKAPEAFRTKLFIF